MASESSESSAIGVTAKKELPMSLSLDHTDRALIAKNSSPDCSSASPLYYRFYTGATVGFSIDAISIPESWAIVGGTVLFDALNIPDLSVLPPTDLSSILPYASGCFDVSTASSYISLTSPASSSRWGIGTDFHAITWVYFGNSGKTVNIDIHSKTTGVKMGAIASKIPIDLQSYTWSINTSLPLGQYYVMVYLKDSKLNGTSNNFTLVAYADDLEASTFVSASSVAYNSSNSFGGMLTNSTEGAEFGLDSDNTFCKAQYASLPFTLYCSLGQKLSYGTNSLTFIQEIGVTFGSSGLSADSTTSMKAWFRMTVPTIQFPLLGDNYFYKTLAGLTLVNGTSFPKKNGKLLQLDIPLSKSVNSLLSGTSTSAITAADVFSSMSSFGYRVASMSDGFGKISMASQNIW